jgi:hypothetical protein
MRFAAGEVKKEIISAISSPSTKVFIDTSPDKPSNTTATGKDYYPRACYIIPEFLAVQDQAWAQSQ